MNERIQELAVEAKLIVPEYNGFDLTKLSASHKIFAYLIIKECAELFPERHYYYSGAAIKRNIKKHFGVEE